MNLDVTAQTASSAQPPSHWVDRARMSVRTVKKEMETMIAEEIQKEAGRSNGPLDTASVLEMGHIDETPEINS